jgi:hypothetical protein
VLQKEGKILGGLGILLVLIREGAYINRIGVSRHRFITIVSLIDLSSLSCFYKDGVYGRRKNYL